MHEGIYIAASGAFKQEKELAVVANNLANVNNTGYKRDGLVFKEMIPPFGGGFNLEAPREVLLSQSQANSHVSYVAMTDFFTDSVQGPQNQTGNELDLAIDGDGFFVVQTDQGNRYTRNGNFRLTQEGHLATQEGLRVMDKDGNPIKIDSTRGKITIDSSGNVFVGRGLANIPSGKINLVRFDDRSQLIKEGNGLFSRAGGASRELPVETPNVRQGFLEGSNVNAMEEMTRMITAVRAFETYQKVIQSIDNADDRAVNSIGRVV